MARCKLFYVDYAGPAVNVWDARSTRVFWRGEHCGASGFIAYAGDHLLIAGYDANSVVEVNALFGCRVSLHALVALARLKRLPEPRDQRAELRRIGLERSCNAPLRERPRTHRPDGRDDAPL